MPNNEAAWLVAKHAPLQVKDAPYTEPGAGEILVSNHAVAVNPVDWFKPSAGGSDVQLDQVPLLATTKGPRRTEAYRARLTSTVARCYRTLSVSSGPAVMNQRLKRPRGASRRKSHMKGAVTLVFGSAFLAISASPRT
jgi:hypothetical protein